MTHEQLNAYKAKWDPSLYLPSCTIPVLFYIGTNDGAFPLDIWQRSAMLTRGRNMLCIPISSEHGHIWNQQEIFAFADAIARNGKSLLQIGKAEIAGGLAVAEIFMVSDSSRRSASALPAIGNSLLIYTPDTCDWQHRQWRSIPAKRKEGRVFSELPPGTRAFYFNITDERGLTFSSAFKEKL